MDEKEIADEFISEFMTPNHKYDILFERDSVIALMIAFQKIKDRD